MEDLQLSETEAGAWERLLQSNHSITRRVDVALRRTHGISLAEHTVLLRLHSAGGDMRMSDLASSALLSPSGASRLVDRLAVDGLVERRACPSDGRAVHAVITGAGCDKLLKASCTYASELHESFIDLYSATELSSLSQLLQRVGRSCLSEA